MAIKLEDYVRLLDRMLERKGLTEEERDKLLNHPDNLDLISQEFEKRAHPTIILKKLNFEPIRVDYIFSESIEEHLVCESMEDFVLNEVRKKKGKKKPTTKKGKDTKFKKVMHEFGKGKLRPYHAKSNLRSKKQGGTKKEYKQGLAIAFSEANLSK